ncbi:MAG: hypothetical protein ACLGH0_02505 [Thermoanaerobaculia bacterium]
MRKIAASLSLLLVTAACASQSASTGSDNVNLSKPEIRIVQTSSVPGAARFSQGPLQVRYTVRVDNTSGEPITLKRITVQSQSEGAYHIQATLPYDVVVAPGGTQDVEFWGNARTGQSLVGANGPVMVRVTAEFDSAVGKFQHIVNRVVNERTSIAGDQ